MNRRSLLARKRGFITALIARSLVLSAGYSYVHDKSNFPDGYDAVQAAPNSHKVLFENAFVRVVGVTIPPPGTTIPMHHHRWPSFLLSWDRGGKTPQVRYLRPDGSVRDIPNSEEPVHAGRWSVEVIDAWWYDARRDLTVIVHGASSAFPSSNGASKDNGPALDASLRRMIAQVRLAEAARGKP